MDQEIVAFARSWAMRYVRTKHPHGLDEGDVENRSLESLYKYSRGKMCGRDGARPSRRCDKAGGPRSCVAVRRGRADARERVPPADATRRQGGRATLPRGRATGEGGRAGARPSRIGEGAGTSGASGRTSSARRPGVRASYPWGGFYEGDVLRGDGHLTAENVVKVRLYNGAERLMARHARAGREEDVVHVDDAHRLVRLPNLFGCEKRPTFPAARKLHAA